MSYPTFDEALDAWRLNRGAMPDHVLTIIDESTANWLAHIMAAADIAECTSGFLRGLLVGIPMPPPSASPFVSGLVMGVVERLDREELGT